MSELNCSDLKTAIASVATILEMPAKELPAAVLAGAVWDANLGITIPAVDVLPIEWLPDLGATLVSR
jgi:Mg/Co/Ni transporter MgtE